jgi:tagatose-1,6-bisphosphate aldolase non-catalytic subunit AgaZ/GatZ
MIKYNNTNNASTTLTAWISASSTTLIVENGDILPTAPFLLTLEHFDNEKVTVREIVKCIAKADNILTIQRGAWTCVQDDSASTKEQGNSAHSFSVGDCASIYWTSEQVQDIQNEIEKKLNIDDFQAWTYVYGATSTW